MTKEVLLEIKPYSVQATATHRELFHVEQLIDARIGSVGEAFLLRDVTGGNFSTC